MCLWYVIASNQRSQLKLFCRRRVLSCNSVVRGSTVRRPGVELRILSSDYTDLSSVSVAFNSDVSAGFTRASSIRQMLSTVVNDPVIKSLELLVMVYFF